MGMEMEMPLEWEGGRIGTGKRDLACPECKLRVRVAFNEA